MYDLSYKHSNLYIIISIYMYSKPQIINNPPQKKHNLLETVGVWMPNFKYWGKHNVGKNAKGVSLLAICYFIPLAFYLQCQQTGHKLIGFVTKKGRRFWRPGAGFGDPALKTSKMMAAALGLPTAARELARRPRYPGARLGHLFRIGGW